MAEIAIAVPRRSSSLASMPRASPTTTMNATAVQAMMPSTLVSEPSSFCSGDRVRGDRRQHGGDLAHLGLHAGRRSTTMAAVPRVTAVFWNSMFDAVAERDLAAGQHVRVLRRSARSRP